ncbi:Arm DNA-binding domain-containing protein [Lacticaseibacillus mingshuiensis]|uniref:Arm DNA-binding domain-containing protein n=1 Tax=Lacticaseibacillus mingshuiensis TaxID=2799574 RepID=UPI00195116D2|nr:Arm DNA-binding domain-containing protein [Lacticaseibacillus mingshuiensis]
MATISSYQLKNGQTRWQVTGYAGVNPGTGKQINFHQRSFLTREAAKNWAKQKTASLIDQSAVNHSKGNMRIADWMHDWIQNYKLNVKEGSMIVYRYNIVAVQKRVVTDTSDFKTLLSYNKCIRNVGFRTFPMHL